MFTDKRPDAEADGGQPVLSRRRLLQAGGTALAAGMASPLLAACGSSPTKASGPTTLTVMSWEIFQTGEWPAWKKVTDEFEKAHPNIKVKWVGWPFANYDQQVIEQAASGQVSADVVQCPPELASTLIQVYNMCDEIGGIAQSLGLTPNPQHSQFEKNGKLYALGVLEVAAALQYSKALVGPGGPPTGIQEWLTLSQQITKPPQVYANFLINTVAAGADWWNQLQNWTLAYDGVWAEGKTLKLNSAANVKGMQLWLDLLHNSGVAGSSEAAIGKLWTDNQVGMLLSVMLGGLASMKVNSPQLFPHLATAAPPWPNKKAISRLHPAVIISSSKNKAAAQELVKWWIEPKNLWYLLQTNGYPVAPYSNFGEKIPQYKTFIDSLPWATGFRETNFVGEYDILGDYVANYAQIGDIITRNIEFAISGGRTVQECLNEAQQEAQSTLKVPK